LAAETLAYLVEVDKELQGIAAISNHLIPTLAEYLKSPSILYKPLLGPVSSGTMTQAAFKVCGSRIWAVGSYLICDLQLLQTTLT
jgi:hypothetical protein